QSGDEQDDVEREQDHGAGEAEVLGEAGEHEVRLRDRQVSKRRLRTGREPLPRRAARADGNERLDDVPAGTLRIRVRIEEGREPRLLVFLEQGPNDRE